MNFLNKLWPWKQLAQLKASNDDLRREVEVLRGRHLEAVSQFQGERSAHDQTKQNTRKLGAILAMRAGISISCILFCLSAFGQRSNAIFPTNVAVQASLAIGSNLNSVVYFPQLGKNVYFDARPAWTYGVSSGHGVGYNIYAGQTSGSSDGEFLLILTNGSTQATGFVPFTNIPPRAVDSVVVGQFIGSAMANAPTNWTLRDSAIIGLSCGSYAQNLDNSYLSGWGTLGGFGGPQNPTNIIRTVAIGSSIQLGGNGDGVSGYSVVDCFFLGSFSGGAVGVATASGNVTNVITLGSTVAGVQPSGNNIFIVGANQNLWNGASNAFNIFGTLFGTNCYTSGTYGNPGKSGQLGVAKYPSNSAYVLDVAGIGSFDAGTRYPMQTAPTAAQIGGSVGTVTNVVIANVHGALFKYWSDGTTLWSQEIGTH